MQHGDLHQHSRRGVMTALGAALACPLCVGVARASGSSAGHGAPHWSYEGEAGPEAWGDLSAENRVCSMGMEQTPIDLMGATRSTLVPVEVAFPPMPATVLNNGHTIQFPMNARPVQPRHRRFLLEYA